MTSNPQTSVSSNKGLTSLQLAVVTAPGSGWDTALFHVSLIPGPRLKGQWLDEECSFPGAGLESRGQATHASAFKPLFGWAGSPVHLHSFSKAQVSGAGQYPGLTARTGGYVVTQTTSEGESAIAAWPEGLEDHWREAGPKRPELKIHSSLRLGHTWPSPHKDQEWRPFKACAESDSRRALPRLHPL